MDARRHWTRAIKKSVNPGMRCQQPLLLCCMLLFLGCWNCTTNRRRVQVVIQAGSDCTVSMREAQILHRPAPGLRLLCSSVGVVAPGVSATASKSSCVGSGRAPRWLPIDTALSGDRVCSRGVWVTGEAAVNRSRGGVSRCAQGVQVGEGGAVTGCAAWGLQNWGTPRQGLPRSTLLQLDGSCSQAVLLCPAHLRHAALTLLAVPKSRTWGDR